MKKKQNAPSRFRRAWITGLLTLIVCIVIAKLIGLIISNTQWLWGWLFELEAINALTGDEHRLLKIPAALALTLLLTLAIGYAMTSERKWLIRIIMLTRLSILPWAPKLTKEGEVVRVQLNELLMWQPALAKIAGKPEVVFLMGDESQDAIFYDARGNRIGDADWVSAFSPGMPTLFSGKVYPMPKRLTIRIENSSLEVVTWLQTYSKQPILWKPRLWPGIYVSVEELEREWGVRVDPHYAALDT